jgi:hypothetical protein
MEFNVNLCFRQKTSKSEIYFQTLTIECYDYLIAEDVINLWTKSLYQIFETNSYKNKRSFLGFKFNRKFDIENLDKAQFKALIDGYIFSGREPIRDEVFKCLDNKPSVLQARVIGE